MWFTWICDHMTNEYSRNFLFFEWEYAYMTKYGFKREMFNSIITKNEKICILGIYFVLRMNYFVLVDLNEYI